MKHKEFLAVEDMAIDYLRNSDIVAKATKRSNDEILKKGNLNQIIADMPMEETEASDSI